MSDQPKSGLLVAAAKTVGAVAGKIASIGKSSPPEAPANQTPAPSEVSGKMAAKHKSRLPRKVKKAQKKAEAKAAAKTTAKH